jgi:5-methylcytosine-specific restriction protein A
VRFRNPNGVYMKLCNFLTRDPDYHGKGLERGGHLEQEVWDEFVDNRELLGSVATAIRKGYKSEVASTLGRLDRSEEDEFPEAKVLCLLNRARGQSAGLVREAKALARRPHGCLACAACGFDFGRAYGPLGDGYIECHHTLPLSELVERRATRLQGVVLLCSNCHRMVHRRRPWLGVSELASLVTGMAPVSAATAER